MEWWTPKTRIRRRHPQHNIDIVTVLPSIVADGWWLILLIDSSGYTGNKYTASNCWHNSLTALHQLVMVGSNGWHQQSLAPVVHRQLYPVLSQGRTWCHVTPVLQLSTCLLSSCGVRSIFIGSTSPVHSNPRCVSTYTE